MNLEPPPPNRAIGWYRMIIWLMPTFIAVSSVFGVDWIRRWASIDLDRAEGICVALVFVSAIVLGWIEPKFDRRWDGRTERSSLTGVIRFVLLQIILVPILGFSVIYGACMIFGY